MTLKEKKNEIQTTNVLLSFRRFTVEQQRGFAFGFSLAPAPCRKMCLPGTYG